MPTPRVGPGMIAVGTFPKTTVSFRSAKTPLFCCTGVTRRTSCPPPHPRAPIAYTDNNSRKATGFLSSVLYPTDPCSPKKVFIDPRQAMLAL